MPLLVILKTASVYLNANCLALQLGRVGGGQGFSLADDAMMTRDGGNCGD
jgi:hypothetical protein